MGKVLVTGANGFVGKVLCHTLIDRGFSIKAAVRDCISVLDDRIDCVSVGEINDNTDWQDALAEVDCVVHLAARVHVMNESDSAPLKAFRRVNTAGSEKLAREAARFGVKRMIYLSSIKVNGEETVCAPFNEHVDQPPVDPYGRSKWEAENALQQVSAETGIEMVIIRPPLVYGPGVKGNFLTLLRMISKGLPLPLGSVSNQRSLVALDNLVDLIKECIVNPRAGGETFLVSDGRDLSTTDLIKTIAHSMGKSPRLIPVPLLLLKMGAVMMGKSAVARRVLGSLQVDSSKAHRILGWSPPSSVECEIEKVVKWYSKNH